MLVFQIKPFATAGRKLARSTATLEILIDKVHIGPTV
jgi:hypothetical protein